MDLRTIETTISSLPPSQLADFDKWYTNFIAKKWDGQLKKDAKNGKLGKLSAKAVKDFYNGEFEEI